MLNHEKLTKQNVLFGFLQTLIKTIRLDKSVKKVANNYYIFLRYCPPTLKSASVICPIEQYLAASMSTANTF